MKFYKYWARGEATVDDGGEPWTVCTYGGSDEGLEAAIRRANEIAASTALAIEQGRSSGPYGYDREALREEVIQEIADETGLAAAITRNSYGVLVLNTSRVMFVDVDYPTPGIGGLLRILWDRLRGKSTPKDERLLTHFNNVVLAQPGLGLRVYRTAGGYRLLVTSATYDPASKESIGLLERFRSDRLYVRLCKAQKCFRARLSAKPWRCGAENPPSRFPWITSEAEGRYRVWEENYHAKANNFATCQLVGSFGHPVIAAAVQPILETHDRLTIQRGATLA